MRPVPLSTPGDLEVLYEHLAAGAPPQPTHSRHARNGPRSRTLATRLVAVPRDRWIGAATVVALLALAALVHGSRIYSTPGVTTTDDEGTYVAQAWAVLYRGQLAHYTYWYDHPPLGWIQLAGYAWITGAFDRLESAISVGREFMLVCKLVSVALLYTYSRRLGINRFYAAFAAGLFVLSPLAVYFGRLTFLDNIALPWMLAAFCLAASPKNRLGAHIGSAVCFGIAFWSKETVLVCLPALLYQLHQGTHPRTRRMATANWFAWFGTICAMYPLTAALKNELLPGAGHVDLLYAIRWQLFDRTASGSIFSAGSAAHAVWTQWTSLDPWLLLIGVGLLPLALLRRELRPPSAALAIQVAMALRPGGYLPTPYVIAVLPFAALVVAGTVDALWNSGVLNHFHRLRRQLPGLRWGYSFAQVAVQLPAAVVTVVFAALVVVPRWLPEVVRLDSADDTGSFRSSMAWLEANAPKHSRIVVSDAMWVDLVQRGFSPDWYFKVDLDPAVHARYRDGWRDVDYAVFTQEMDALASSSAKADMATVVGARDHGVLVARYGAGAERISIYRVNRASGTSGAASPG